MADNHIVFIPDYCLRTYGAYCERCVLACPACAISFDENNHAHLDQEACTHCGICLGICDGFSSTRLTITDLYERFRRIALQGEKVILTCKENIFPGFEPASNVIVLPCLAMLSPEFWTLALSEDIPLRVACDLSYCLDCERAGNIAEMLYTHAIETAEAWTGKTLPFIKEIPEKRYITKELANPTGVDRRDAFTNLIGDVGEIASGKRRLRNSSVLQQFYERREKARARNQLNLSNIPEIKNFAPAGERKKLMTPKRLMLLEALSSKPESAPRIPLVRAQTDYTRCKKELDCVRICPTGACSLDQRTKEICDDARYCIGCGLCVNACPHNARVLIETTAEILLPSLQEEKE